MTKKDCPKGYRWWPIKKKCIPEDQDKGQGKRQARGKGQGPMGVPQKEQNTMDIVDRLVDEMLNGNYKLVKIHEKANTLVDVILDSKVEISEETAYQKYFKGMLKKHGYNSPSDIPADKKKEFFNAVDKGWKGEKTNEAVNSIDHVPEEDADELLSSIEDEIGKEEEMRTENKSINEDAIELVKAAFQKVREERNKIK